MWRRKEQCYQVWNILKKILNYKISDDSTVSEIVLNILVLKFASGITANLLQSLVLNMIIQKEDT